MSTPEKRRWATVLLVSLALNLFLAGYLIAGGVFRGHQRSYPGPGTFDMLWAGKGLDEGAKPVLKRVWSTHGETLGPRMKEMRAAQNLADNRMIAEDFDRQSLAAALADLRVKSLAVQEILHGAMVDLAVELTPEQRQRLARSGRHRFPQQKRPSQR